MESAGPGLSVNIPPFLEVCSPVSAGSGGAFLRSRAVLPAARACLSSGSIWDLRLLRESLGDGAGDRDGGLRGSLGSCRGSSVVL